ncbi:MAG TPA: hypothetical protein VGB08_02650 [Allosphingosinicella sp.]|jgi:hypothetical protein
MNDVASRELEQRLERLERQLKRSRLGLFAAASAMILAAGGSMARADQPAAAPAPAAVAAAAADGVLRLRGLVIEDSAGRPRIVMGAPAPAVAGRNRRDALTGIVYIDENGADRLTFGREPDPMTERGIVPRRVQGAGILIHDRQGIERGGYAVLDDESAILTLDYPRTGEGIALSANERFAAVGVFHRSPLGQYREAVTMGAIRDGEQSFIKMTDTAQNERWRVEARGAGEPRLLVYGAGGREVRSVPIR